MQSAFTSYIQRGTLEVRLEGMRLGLEGSVGVGSAELAKEFSGCDVILLSIIGRKFNVNIQQP